MPGFHASSDANFRHSSWLLRLRSLGNRLVLLVVVAAMAWTARAAWQASVQREAVAAIQRLGGEVGMNNFFRDRLAWQPRGAGWLSTTFPNWTSRVETVSLRGQQIGEQQLRLLAKFPLLTRIDLSHSRMPEDGLERLARFSRLEQLILQDSDVSDHAVARLRRLRPTLDIDTKPVGD